MPVSPAQVRRYALTLLEVLIALVLSSLLMIAAVTSLFALLNNLRANDALVRSRQSAVASVNLMVNKARRAQHITVSASPNTLRTIDSGTYNGSAWTETHWTQFSLSGQTLNVTSDSNTTAVAVLSNVTTLDFTANAASPADAKNPNHYVTITLTVTQPDSYNPAKKTPFTLSATALVRSSLQ